MFHFNFIKWYWLFLYGTKVRRNKKLLFILNPNIWKHIQQNRSRCEVIWVLKSRSEKRRKPPVSLRSRQLAAAEGAGKGMLLRGRVLVRSCISLLKACSKRPLRALHWNGKLVCSSWYVVAIILFSLEPESFYSLAWVLSVLLFCFCFFTLERAKERKGVYIYYCVLIISLTTCSFSKNLEGKLHLLA